MRPGKGAAADQFGGAGCRHRPFGRRLRRSRARCERQPGPLFGEGPFAALDEFEPLRELSPVRDLPSETELNGVDMAETRRETAQIS